jgi:outer membrane protein with beta-barrel domain
MAMTKGASMRALVLLILGAATAHAQPADQPASTTGVLVAGKVGGIVPFDGLSPFVALGVEVGYALPSDRRLAIVFDVDYTQPTKTGSETDPRVTGGMYTWKLTEQELGLMPVIEYRFLGMTPVAPYVGIGPRLLLARSTVQSDTTPVIMETHEQSTRIGVGVPVGAELSLGPGAAIGELLFQFGTLNHTATGDANTAAASLSVGYRMTF